MSDGPEYSVGLASHSQANFYRTLEDEDVAGVFVPTWESHPIGTSVTVHVELPGDEKFTVTGTVEWGRDTERATTWPGLGIRFGELGERERSLVERFSKNRGPLLFDE